MRCVFVNIHSFFPFPNKITTMKCFNDKLYKENNLVPTEMTFDYTVILPINLLSSYSKLQFLIINSTALYV